MASSDPFMGSVDLWPLDWAPKDWVLCNGQLLPVNTYQPLFSLLGNRYGGVFPTTFAVPNMQGRVPIGVGRGSYPNPTIYALAQTGGIEQTTLTASQLPAQVHTHQATYVEPAYTIANTDPVYSAAATGTVTPKAKTGPGPLTNVPTNAYLAGSGANSIYSTTANGNMGCAEVAITVALTKTTAGSVALTKTTAGSVTVQPTQTGGTSQPFDNRMPFLALNYIIAVQGIYPPRPE